MKLLQFKISWSAMFIRGAMFALVWWLLTGGDSQSWWLGVPAVLAATTINVLAVGPIQFRWLQTGRFVGFFLKRSLAGAVDVSRRTIHPSLPLAPILAKYRLRIPPGGARTLLVNVISLLPGTLSADVEGDDLLIHVLDETTDYTADIMEVEQAVARLYGIDPLTSPKSSRQAV